MWCAWILLWTIRSESHFHTPYTCKVFTDYIGGAEAIIASFPDNFSFSFSLPCHSPFGGKYSLKLILGYFAEVRWYFSWESLRNSVLRWCSGFFIVWKTIYTGKSFIWAEFFINLPCMQMYDHFTVQCQQQNIPSVKLAHWNVDCPFPLGTAVSVLVIKILIPRVSSVCQNTNSNNLLHLQYPLSQERKKAEADVTPYPF